MKPLFDCRHTLYFAFHILVGSSLAPWAQANEPAKSADAPPPLAVGPGYYALLPQKILLAGKINPPLDAASTRLKWSMKSGPGDVSIERPESAITWARATVPGKYVFTLTTESGAKPDEQSVTVNVYPAGSYTGNPILPGMFPDPHVLHDSGRFYIYATSMENDAGAYGRASVWSSSDFVNWEMKLTNWPVYGKFGGEIWAPDIIRKGEKYYQFITRSGYYDTIVAVAEHPEGPWKNLREDGSAIVGGGGNAGRMVPAYNMDAQPFIDDDGQAYMYWGWSESMAAKLTSDLKNIDGPVYFLKGTKWLPDGGELPQWLAVDLGESLPITKVHISPEFPNVVYAYKVEISEDGQNWALLIDQSSNTTQTAGAAYEHDVAGTGRHLRITFSGCGGHWAGLYDFSVFSSEKKVSLGKVATASSIRGPGSEAARPGHNSVLLFNNKYYIVYHQHNQPHEDAGGVFRQTCADLMEFNPDGTIKEVTPTQTGVGPLQASSTTVAETDWALGCYATATSVKSAAYVPEYALDQNFASKWRASDNRYPQVFSVDLKQERAIERIETSFEYPTLSYKYRLECSLDGKSWEPFADQSKEFLVAVSPRKHSKSVRARYVRMVVDACERPENGAGLYSFKVLGR